MKNWQLIFVMAVMNYLLWVIFHGASQTLAPWNLSLHFEILLIIFPALYLSAVPGLIHCTLFTLILGAFRPTPLFATLLALLLLWNVGIFMRNQLQPQNRGHVGLAAGFLQLILVLGWSLFQAASAVDPSAFWLRVCSEATLSALFTGLLAGIWCDLQLGVLSEMGWQFEKV